MGRSADECLCASIGLRRIQPRILPTGEQLLKNVVMHGEQLAVVLVELLTLHSEITDLPPMLLKGVTALTRAAGQQAAHANTRGFQTESREHLALRVVGGESRGKVNDDTSSNA